MGATNLKETLFGNAHDKIKDLESELAQLQKNTFPTPGIKVALGKYKLQVTKMKTHLHRLETLYLKRRANAVHASLLVLEGSVSDRSYVGSARSEEAYRTAKTWLASYKVSSADLFYKRVQTAAVDYASLK